MDEESRSQSLVRKVAPRVAKAGFWGAITYIFTYHLPMLQLGSLLEGAPTLPGMEGLVVGGKDMVLLLAIILVSFTVAVELASGTIIQFFLGFARGFILLIFFIYALQGGVFTLTIPYGPAVVKVLVDLRALLGMLILVDALGLIGTVLRAVNFLSESVEKAVAPPRPRHRRRLRRLLG